MKKVLAFACGLLMVAGAMAQDWEPTGNARVSADDIRFWTGKGTNKAVVAVTWNDNGTGYVGIAWGVKWDGEVALTDLMDTIAAYDTRFNVVWNAERTNADDMTFVSEDLDLDLAGDVVASTNSVWWMYNWYDVADEYQMSQRVDQDTIENGAFIDWLQMDPETFEGYTADVMIVIADPNDNTPMEATIGLANIEYWVGTGSNEVLFAVNWADTALAWGYRFSTDSVSVQEVMDSLQAADPRFSYVTSGRYLTDIRFVVAEGDTLGITPGNFFESKTNDQYDGGMFQMLGDADFHKWADPAAGVAVDSSYYEGYGYMYSYVYPMEIHPVSVPQPSSGIEGVESVSVTVYPNPATTEFTVSFEALAGATEAALYDMAGRRLMVRSLEAGATSLKVATDGLEGGVYMLRIAGATAKVIVR